MDKHKKVKTQNKKDAIPGLLNFQVELATNANCMMNPLAPNPGTLMLGDVGIEFRSDGGGGFVQIPWESVDGVVVDIQGKKYVRSISVAAEGNAGIPFVVSKGDEVVRVINEHVGRDKLHANVSATNKIVFGVKGVFKKIGEKFK